jgi:hypothetical protein
MLTNAVRQFVFMRDTWHCRNCFNSNGLDPHHVVYKSAGGTDTANNLLTLCRKCHDDIHAGRLRIEVVDVLVNNIVVKFWKQVRWKP